MGFSPSGNTVAAPTSSQTATAPIKTAALTKAAVTAPPAAPLVSESDFFDSLGGGDEPASVADDTISSPDDVGADTTAAPPSVGAFGAETGFVPTDVTYAPAGNAPTSPATTAAVEAELHAAILVGNLPAAVDACVALGRMAEALVLR